MRIAVIGPSDIDRVAAAAGIDPDKIRDAAADAGRVLAATGHELAVVPDRGVPVIVAKSYRNAAGPKIWGFIPVSGDSAEGATSRVRRNAPLCDACFDNLTWFEQHSRLMEFADAALCIGMSCGTLCEIAWTKWTRKIPVYVVKSLCSGVPPEIAVETTVHYIDSPADMIRSGGGMR